MINLFVEIIKLIKIFQFVGVYRSLLKMRYIIEY